MPTPTPVHLYSAPKDDVMFVNLPSTLLDKKQPKPYRLPRRNQENTHERWGENSRCGRWRPALLEPQSLTFCRVATMLT